VACANGSEPKPDAPKYFLYEVVDLAAILGTLGGKRSQITSFVTLNLLDLPTTPQQISDL
jgi:hypothetical protein